MSAAEFLPSTIVYGCEKPEMRFRTNEGRQVFFCLSNGNLHLTDRDLNHGTYEMGALLGSLCQQHCFPERDAADRCPPCPAFAHSHRVGKNDGALATVEMRPMPKWDACPGVRKLLEIEMTEEERYFLTAYLDDHWTDEFTWRDELVGKWNANWFRVEDGWGKQSRVGLFDQMLWWTVRCPALIPQVWLNWLHAAPDAMIKTLEEGRASRVDFVAFARGERHVIEIDGLSHYAVWHETSRTYSPDEKEYARNLKIERWLRAEGWRVTRIGRYEVKHSMKDDEFLGAYALMKVLPFGRKEDYPEQPPAEYMCCPELDTRVYADDIPF